MTDVSASWGVTPTGFDFNQFSEQSAAEPIRPAQTLNQLCEVAARVALAPVSIISCVGPERTTVLGQYGSKLVGMDSIGCRKVIDVKHPTIVAIPDVSRDPRSVDHPIRGIFPHLRAMTVVPFPVPLHGHMGCMTLLDPARSTVARPEKLAIIAQLAELAKSTVRSLLTLESIAAREQAEEDLALTTLCNTAMALPLPLFIVDRQARIVGANEVLLRLSEQKLESVLGRRPGEAFCRPEPRLDDLCRNVIESGLTSLGVEITVPNGRVFNFFCFPVCARSVPKYFACVVVGRGEAVADSAALSPNASGFRSEPGQTQVSTLECLEPAGQFLVDTLVFKQALHTRRGCSYVTLRTWRKPIKDYQMRALVALKAALPASFVAQVGEEFAETARTLPGAERIGCVVPVPCGSSARTDCFSAKLARSIAQRLGVPCIEALSGSAETGASHPRKSAKLEAYSVTKRVKGTVLLVDDVASSGRHLELATNALRAARAAVIAMAWIGK
jgi:PAS domain-containing protein